MNLVTGSYTWVLVQVYTPVLKDSNLCHCVIDVLVLKRVVFKCVLCLSSIVILGGVNPTRYLVNGFTGVYY